jgi:hypothetical protein
MIAIARDDEAPDEPGPPIDVKAVAIGLAVRGFKVKDIVEMVGKSKSTVYQWINDAWDAGLMGRMPKHYEFTPRLECRCADDPIKLGELFVCVHCCQSGFDYRPEMHGKPLPPERKAYRPDAKLKGGSGDAAADESAGQEAAAEAREDGRLGARAGRRSHARGRRR